MTSAQQLEQLTSPADAPGTNDYVPRHAYADDAPDDAPIDGAVLDQGSARKRHWRARKNA
jgi:hypothetical protein